MNDIRRLLEERGVSAPAVGVSEAELAALEGDTGLRLPASVRDLYAAIDGVILNEQGLQLVSLRGAQELFEMLRTADYTQRWGYLPLTENQDSNPFCVCCRAPLTGYVVHVMHDDNSQIKFRTVGSFLTALSEFARREEWDLDKMPSDFDRAERTEADVAIGRELLRMTGERDAQEKQDALRFGMCLLSEAQVEEITPLLEYEDVYVREDVRQRLSAMQSPAATAALERDAAEFRHFVAQAALMLTEAGIQSTVVNEVDVRLDPGPVWLNMKMFYARRHSDGMDFLLERARTFLAFKQRA